jgi:Na+/melibiose symporter-like transporter
MNNVRSWAPGLLLIILGALLLAGNLYHVSMKQLWPVFVVGPGLFFFALFLSNQKDYGLLMPASILTVIGCLFFYCAFYGWYNMRYLWPWFMLAPAIGFVLMYFLGIREQGLLIPAGILSGLGLIFLVVQSELDYLWPLILILAGILVIVSSWQPKRPEQTKSEGQDIPL